MVRIGVSLPKMKNTQNTLLIYSASEGDANMLYATGFFVPDPFIFFKHRGRKYAVMSDLEIDRAKRQANVDTVLSLSSYQQRLRKAGKQTTPADVLEAIFRERGVRRITVPANFPTLLTDELRRRKFRLDVKRDPFFPERERKRADEVKKISDSLRVAELGLEAGIAALKRAKIGRDRYLFMNGSRLTS